MYFTIFFWSDCIKHLKTWTIIYKRFLYSLIALKVNKTIIDFFSVRSLFTWFNSDSLLMLSRLKGNVFQSIISSFCGISRLNFIPEVHSIVVDFLLNFLHVSNNVISFKSSSDKSTIRHLDNWVNKLVLYFLKNIGMILGVGRSSLEEKFRHFIVMRIL